MKERIGLIDIGSNSIRLVVFQIEDNFALHELQNLKIPARIYQYLDEESVLSEQGRTVLLAVLETLSEEARHWQVDKIIAKGTAALRAAANRDAIVEEIKERLGLDVEIISGKKEAYFGVTAIFHTLTLSDGVALDIGGGSSEITLFKNKQIVESYSFPFGAVSLQEQFFAGKDHNDADAIKQTRKFIHAAFDEHPFMKDVQLPLIGIGGSARNIVRIYQSSIDYPLAGLHNFRLTREHLEHVYELLIESSMKDLKNLDGLSADRADIIVPALLVFMELFDYIEAPIFRFSQPGLREGIIYDYVERAYPEAYDINHVAEQTIERLSSLYHFDESQAKRRVAMVRRLYQLLDEEKLFSFSEDDLKLLCAAAFCYNLGETVEPNGASQHTFYLLANTNLYGFTHKERVALSLLASYKNRSLFKTYLSLFSDWFTKDESKSLQQLGGFIKFCHALTLSRTNTIHDLSITKEDDDAITLHIVYSGILLSEVPRSEDQKKHLERMIDRDVYLDFIHQEEKTAV